MGIGDLGCGELGQQGSRNASSPFDVLLHWVQCLAKIGVRSPIQVCQGSCAKLPFVEGF